MRKITPFLWFDDKAEEAAKFYTSIFKNSKIGDIARYDEEAAKPTGRPPGSVMVVEFQLDGRTSWHSTADRCSSSRKRSRLS